MAEHELRELISRAREGGGLFASDSEVLTLAGKAEEILAAITVERARNSLLQMELDALRDSSAATGREFYANRHELQRLREQLEPSEKLATALIRVGRLEAELETARERLSVEMDRFDTLAELVGECAFRVGSVDLDAADFVATGTDGEPDWSRAWREAVDAHLARMESVEYLGRLTDPSGSETTEHDGPDCTDR